MRRSSRLLRRASPVRPIRDRCSPSASPMPRPCAIAVGDRDVHLAPGLFGGAESAVGQHRLHIFAGLARDRDFEIVNRRRAVHRERRRKAAPHQVEQHRREAALDDVAAHAPDDLLPCGSRVQESLRPRCAANRPRAGAASHPAAPSTPSPLRYGLAKCSRRTLPPRSWIDTVFSPPKSSGCIRYLLKLPSRSA